MTRVKRLLALFLAAAILGTSTALCESITTHYDSLDTHADTVRYTGRAKTALMVRAAADPESEVIGRYSKGDNIDILIISSAWAKVRREDADGYVQTRYIKNVKTYDALTGEKGGDVAFLEPIGAVISVNGFIRNYIAHALSGAKLHEQPDDSSNRLVSLKKNQAVYVSAFRGDGWALCEVDENVGYVQTDSLFRVDKLDPRAPAVPNLVIYPYMALIKRDTALLDEAGKPQQTLPEGVKICVMPPDARGRCATPYMRGTGYIARRDISELIPVSPFDGANAGELISVMTTYYAPISDEPLPTDAVDTERELELGRAYNISLAAERLNGRVIEPDGQLSVNSIIGPYDKLNGYRLAKIINSAKATGHGGGVCQVSTTLYNALLPLPVYMNERNVHSYSGVSYIPQGFDSALANRGNIDLIFTNTLSYPIRIEISAYNGVVTACVYHSGEQ